MHERRLVHSATDLDRVHESASDIEDQIDQIADDEIEDAMDIEDQVTTVTGLSDYDNLYAAIARKSMNRAAMLDENPEIAEVIKKVMLGVERYCWVHQCTAADLSIQAKITSEGRVVVFMYLN